MDFSFRQIIKHSICPKQLKPRDRKLVNLYHEIESYVMKKLDIVFYLKTLENFEKLKLLTLSTEQNLIFDFLKRPDLSDKEELYCFEFDLNRNKSKESIILVNYFIQKALAKNLDKIDIEMLPLIDPELKSFMIGA
jgi:hypothetical protein